MLDRWIGNIEKYFLPNVLYKHLLEKMEMGIIYNI